MKPVVQFLLILFSVMSAHAQNSVGVGTNTPHPSAAVDVAAANKGFLVPRMSQSQRLAIVNPPNGLLVYDSTSHRLYQVQEGEWRYMLTSADWVQSPTRNWTYNAADSVGIGTSFPTQRLDVNGTMQSRNNVEADNVIANGNLTTNTLTGTNFLVDQNLTVNGNITSNGELGMGSTAAILQLQDGAAKKTFFQINGNDLRFGTNSSNNTGQTIFRLNGNDAISIDRSANITMLRNSTNQGEIIVGWKVARKSAPEINMLPVVFGYVPGDGGPVGWMSPFAGNWERISTGVYEIRNYGTAGINPYCVIVATPVGNAFNLCTARYVSDYTFRIEMFNRDGIRTDCAFTYVVNSPLNF